MSGPSFGKSQGERALAALQSQQHNGGKASVNGTAPIQQSSGAPKRPLAPLAPKAPLPHLSAPAKRARRSPSPSNEAEQQDAFAFAGGARSAPGQLNAHPLAAPRAANGLRTASRLGPAAVGNDGNGNGDAQMQRRLSFGDACDATPTPLATKTFIKSKPATSRPLRPDAQAGFARGLAAPLAGNAGAAVSSVAGNAGSRGTLTPFLSRPGLVCPAGLVNAGNTCYLNAVLQCLLSLPSFVEDLRCAVARWGAAQPPAIEGASTAAGADTSAPAFASAGASAGDGSGSGGVAAHPLPVCRALLGVAESLEASAVAAAAGGGPAFGVVRASTVDPSPLRAAMGANAKLWRSTAQQDAHELLIALLDQVQGEVLAAEARAGLGCRAPTAASPVAPVAPGEASAEAAAAAANADADIDIDMAAAPALPAPAADAAAAAAPMPARTPATTEAAALAAAAARGNAPSSSAPAPTPAVASTPAAAAPVRIPLSATACPAARNLSGCLRHEFRCAACGHESHKVEQLNHVSMEMPTAASPALGAPPTDLQALLANHFKEETVEKLCDACKAPAAPHRVRHTVARLPRVLVLHLKRFRMQQSSLVGLMYRKLRAEVTVPAQLALDGLVQPGSRLPPLIAQLAAEACRPATPAPASAAAPAETIAPPAPALGMATPAKPPPASPSKTATAARDGLSKENQPWGLASSATGAFGCAAKGADGRARGAAALLSVGNLSPTLSPHGAGGGKLAALAGLSPVTSPLRSPLCSPRPGLFGGADQQRLEESACGSQQIAAGSAPADAPVAADAFGVPEPRRDGSKGSAMRECGSGSESSSRCDGSFTTTSSGAPRPLRPGLFGGAPSSPSRTPLATPPGSVFALTSPELGDGLAAPVGSCTPPPPPGGRLQYQPIRSLSPSGVIDLVGNDEDDELARVLALSRAEFEAAQAAQELGGWQDLPATPGDACDATAGAGGGTANFSGGGVGGFGACDGLGGLDLTEEELRFISEGAFAPSAAAAAAAHEAPAAEWGGGGSATPVPFGSLSSPPGSPVAAAGGARLADLFAEVATTPAAADGEGCLQGDATPEVARLASGSDGSGGTSTAANRKSAGPQLIFELVEDDSSACGDVPAVGLLSIAANAEGCGAGRALQASHAAYDLHGVIRHIGFSAQGGHYVADARQLRPLASRPSNGGNGSGGATGGAEPPAPEWFAFDDSFVKQTSLGQAQAASCADGYLFVYVNRSIPWIDLAAAL